MKESDSYHVLDYSTEDTADITVPSGDSNVTTEESVTATGGEDRTETVSFGTSTDATSEYVTDGQDASSGGDSSSAPSDKKTVPSDDTAASQETTAQMP